MKLYTNGSWKSGDSYETKDLLSKFIKYKSKLPLEKRDINKFNSVSALYSMIQTLEEQGVKSQKDVKREGAEVVYEDAKWKIVIPHTEEASCIYGAQTKWCTAGRENNMFNYYNKQGLLYININKVTGEKYQFHFESDSFMDAEDIEISPKEIELSEGAVNYYKSIGKEPYFIYDYVGKFSNVIACVKLEGKGWNFINTNGKLLWKEDKWFDEIWGFRDGFAKVEIEGKYNFINTNGELLWKEDNCFDLVWSFFDGFAIIKLEGKGYNYINTQGELVWKEDKWFDKVSDFCNGYARVYIKGKGWNFINTNGELLWKEDKWFDEVCKFHKGIARVKIEGKYNFIDEQCKLVWKEDKWFDNADDFYEGFASVQIGKKWNYINTKGELLWNKDKWFDNVGWFVNGFAIVNIDGRGWNFINEQGKLLWNKDKWFDDAWSFRDGFAEVKIEDKLYKLNTKGELIENYFSFL